MSQDGVIRVQCLQFTRSSVVTVSIFRCLHYFRYRPLDRWRHNGHVVVCGSWCRVLESGCRVRYCQATWHKLTQFATSYQLSSVQWWTNLPVYHKQFARSKCEVQRDQTCAWLSAVCLSPLCWWYLSSRWRPCQGRAFQLFVPLDTFSNHSVTAAGAPGKLGPRHRAAFSHPAAHNCIWLVLHS